MGWVLDDSVEASERRKFKRPASCKSKSSCACTCVDIVILTCSLWLGVVGMIRKFETWFDAVNAPTQLLVDVEAQDAQDAQGSGGGDDEEV